MTLGHVETGYSLLEKPSSFNKEVFTRSVFAALLLVLMFLVNGCKPMYSLGLPHAHGFLSKYDLDHENHGNKTIKIRRSDSAGDQCLFLDSSCIANVCHAPVDIPHRSREVELRKLNLRFCGNYAVVDVISLDDMDGSIRNKNCTKFLRSVKDKDDEVAQMYKTFMEVLNKFDCARTQYSVKWSCSHCQTAYKNWLCSININYYHPKYFNGNVPLPPCSRFCEEVEQKCPFFRPETFDVQAGEPSFICKDRDINRTDRLSDCLKECHLREKNSCDFVFSSGQNPTTTVTTLPESPSNSSSPSSGAPGSLRTHYPHCSSVLINITFMIFSLWTTRTLLQYLSIGWT